MCCVCYPKRLSRYDFLLIPWWKQRNLPAYVCGCIKSKALVSTDNTLEVDFYLHVHVSFHVQVTYVGVPLVDECCCKTTGKWNSHRPTVINFIRRVWYALHLEKTHNWLRPVSVTVLIQEVLRTEEGEHQPPVSATHRYLRLELYSFWRSATFRLGVRLYRIECHQRRSPSHICQVSSFFFRAVRCSLFNPSKLVVTICTASLTWTNSTFCQHSVFMCWSENS